MVDKFITENDKDMGKCCILTLIPVTVVVVVIVLALAFKFARWLFS